MQHVAHRRSAPATPTAAAPAEAVWSWTAPAPSPPSSATPERGKPRPDHIHARQERARLVLIITGSAGGSIAGRLGGAHLPWRDAVELAQFILASAPPGITPRPAPVAAIGEPTP